MRFKVPPKTTRPALPPASSIPTRPIQKVHPTTRPRPLRPVRG